MNLQEAYNILKENARYLGNDCEGFVYLSQIRELLESEEMPLKDAKEILRKHNEWRRGGEGEMIEPKKLGIAIHTIINSL
jgi:hypothetical protein